MSEETTPPVEPLADPSAAPAAGPAAEPATEPTVPHRRRRRRRVRSRRRTALWVGLGVGALLAVLVAIGGALAAFRYLPAYDDAKAMRGDLEQMVSRIRDAGLDMDRSTVVGLEADLAAARARYDTLAALLANDPLVALARAVPATAPDVNGADAIVAAAGELFGAADDGVAIGRRFVEIKEAQAADPASGSALSQLVELIATSREPIAGVTAAIGRARQTLAGVPDGLVGPLEEARDAMITRLDEYGPMVDGLAQASGPLPSILGWDAPRRYLVLTQNPAELRPTGGYTGSYGIIAFDKGRITESTFQDIAHIDLPWDYPFIKGPQELHDYLLGETQPWQLADANWSPNFPTSAQDAIRLYENESGDTHIDGVIALSTYTIDHLLELTGPITVPGYDVTIAPGETTLKLMQAIWAATASGTTERKAVLGPFAQQLFASLLGLPPESWGRLAGDAETYRRERLLLAWFKDPEAQALVAENGFDGAIRQDPGDYVYPVDSNVAPTSKLNAVTTRSLDLQVQIDEYGNAQDRLKVTWDNGIETDAGAPYRALPIAGDLRILGMYFRLLVPELSRVEEVSGGSYVPLSDPAVVQEANGRAVIGNYLKIPPGRTSLTYGWTSPYAADADETGGTYRLTIQKQPGLLPGPLSLTIRVPEGFRITGANPELVVVGGTATLETTFDADLTLDLRYARAATP